MALCLRGVRAQGRRRLLKDEHGALRAIGDEGWLEGRGARGLDFVNGVEASFSSDIRMIRV